MRGDFFRVEGKGGAEHGRHADRGAVLGQGQGGAGGEQAEIRRRLTFHRPEHSGKPNILLRRYYQNGLSGPEYRVFVRYQE